MKPHQSNEFDALKREIEGQPRLAGYYIIKLVEIDPSMADKAEEDVAEELFKYFDDQEWPPAEKRPKDQSWSDYVTDRSTARRHAVESLVGGPAVGHLQPTILPAKAEKYFDRFDALFDDPKRYYVGLGFGNREYVFSGGVAIISGRRAGLIWVVESD